MKVYISLTTIFGNQPQALKCLESIENQTYKPNKCFLYLSEKGHLQDQGFLNKNITNKALIDKIKNNDIFETHWVENTGPYRKLLPLLQSRMHEACIIITIDDDTYYHPKFIENSVNHYRNHECCIAYRSFSHKCKKIQDFNKSYIDRYCAKGTKGVMSFHTGKGGVLYTPKMFTKVKDILFDKHLYLKLCPTNDDIWFNFLRILNNVELYTPPEDSYISDMTTSKALWTNYNSKQAGNLSQIQSTIKYLENHKKHYWKNL